MYITLKYNIILYISISHYIMKPENCQNMGIVINFENFDINLKTNIY